MEVEGATKRLPEKACADSTFLPESSFLKSGVVDDCSDSQAFLMSKQASHPAAFSFVATAQSFTKSSYTGINITATLENESVWSRFHSLGTEMILTKQGRRMFPCCRFKLGGLDPERKYMLVMDIIPLDDFIYKWNGETWEPVAKGKLHVLGQVCIHPDSPALGQLWMENPVSFYKVKLTNISTDQEGCVFLHPMHRYQPRLHVVPVDPHSEPIIALDSPSVQMFTFPKTEFYAVTSYQNPQITQLKIDCNPFAMAFRKDTPSIRLLQDRLGLCSPVGPQAQLSKHVTKLCIKDHRKNPEPLSPKEKDTISEMKNAVSSCLNGVASCKKDMNSSVNDRDQEDDVNQLLTKPTLHEHDTSFETEPNVTASIQEPPHTIYKPVFHVSNVVNSMVTSEDALNSKIGNASEKSTISAQFSQSQGRLKLPKSSFLYINRVNRHNAAATFRHKPFRRARKPKSKWWSNVKNTKPPSVIATLDVSLRPDLEDVEGMLFVSFVEKEALDVHVQKMKDIEIAACPAHETQDQSDDHLRDHLIDEVNLSVEERISKLENTLLLHLKQQKHRQVIHPLLQEVGLKLNLLDPMVSIDLQYLGVCLPFPLPIQNSLDQVNPMIVSSSNDGASSFVSRTGKTNDPTKIKGWRDKFNAMAVQRTSEGPRNKSAFCSDMLDEYLANEAQQISERAAVFSNSFSTPISYQLPSKSSSYVVTLDSLLKNRSTPLNKVFSNSANNIHTGPSHKRSHRKDSPLYSGVAQNQNDQDISSNIPGTKIQPNRPRVRWSCGMTPAKTQMNCILQDMEKDALFHGKIRTHITTERANFALSSLLTFQKSVKRPQMSLLHHEKDGCPEDFCRLGCICDSLQRKIRGPTHCRRVQCMFDCNCFKHKVLLIHPPTNTTVQEGRRRPLMAFPIANPVKADRPPPATNITKLWKWRTEDDPEPLFVPKPAPSLKKMPRMRNYVPHPTPQIQEEDKDPVYLYFESMMTCARVREYNSNPPPQVHMFPTKKLIDRTKRLKQGFEAGVPPASQNGAASQNGENSIMGTKELAEAAPSAVKTDEPAPTKLLEILSECNWEPHRNLVLSALFWRMSNNLFSEPFNLGIYKVQLLSTTLKRGETSSTVTYKVCVSLAENRKVTNDQAIERPVKTRKTRRGTSTVSEHTAPRRKSSPLIGKQPKKPPCKKLPRIFPLLTRALPAGYLKAVIKRPGGPVHGLIKVNGKTYNQAKLLLGQMGALQPANRFAAFVMGRLCSNQDQPKVLPDEPKPCFTEDPVEASVEPNAGPKEMTTTKPTCSTSPKPHPASAPAADTISKKKKKSKLTPLQNLSEQSTYPKDSASKVIPAKPAGTNPIVSAGSKLVHIPASPETATTSTLPSGQQLILQHIPGSNLLCQYNGQVIQLVPIASGPTAQPQTCFNSEGSITQNTQTAVNTCVPQDSKAIQKPLSSLSPANTLPGPLPITPPKIVSLSGSSGINIASGTPAFNLQSSFPGKVGTFSFRICPPSAESKAVGSQPGAKPPDTLVAAGSSVLVLPGGFTLIKLPLGSHTGLPAVPANTPTTSQPVKLPQKNKCMEKEISQDCSVRTEQKCQATESNTSTSTQEIPNNSSTDKAVSSDDNSIKTSKGFGEDELKEEPLDSVAINKETADKYDLVPVGVELVLDVLPPKEAERVLWMDEDSGDEDNNKDFIQNSNADASVRNPNGMTVKDLQNAKADVSHTACDACLCEESEFLPCPETHGNGLPPETDEHSKRSSDEPKHMKSSPSAKDKEKIHDDPFANPDCYNPEENSEQESSLNISSVTIKKECNDKHTEKLSPSPCNISMKFLQDGYPSPKKDMVDIKPIIQDIVPENNSPVISKTEATNNLTQIHTLSNHLGIAEQCLIPKGFIKEEPNCDPPETDTSCDHLVNEQSSASDILPIFYKQASSNFPSSNNTSVLQHAEDDNDYIDIEVDFPCPLLEGQTPPISSLPVHLSSDASKNTDLKNNVQVTLHDDQDPGNCSDSDHCKGSSDEVGNSSSNEEESSNAPESASDSETTEESANASSKEDERVDIESFEENQEKMIITKMRAEITRCRKAKQRKAKRHQFSKKLNQRANKMEHLAVNDLAKRLSHTEKERLRRGEMRLSFESLKMALNIEEQIKMCKHEILIQARLMIRALEDRNRTLEERKKALLQRQIAYVSTIAQLTGKTEEIVKTKLTERYEQEKLLDIQKLVTTSVSPQVNPQGSAWEGNQLSPLLGEWKSDNYVGKGSKKMSGQPSTTSKGQKKTFKKKEDCEEDKEVNIQNLISFSESSLSVNPRRLDSEGNHLPPRLGRWKSVNYIRKRSKKSSEPSLIAPAAVVDESSDTCISGLLVNHTSGSLPSSTAGDVLLKIVTQSTSDLPPVPKPKHLSEDLRPPETGPFTLPKIVLQSFGKTDTTEELLSLEHSSPTSSPHATIAENPPDVILNQLDKEARTETSDSLKECREMENSSGSEESNKENPSSSPSVDESSIQSHALPELEKDKQTSAGLVKVRKRRSKSEVVLEDALSNPDALEPRMLRNRSASNRMSTRSTPVEKRQRFR